MSLCVGSSFLFVSYVLVFFGFTKKSGLGLRMTFFLK